MCEPKNVEYSFDEVFTIFVILWIPWLTTTDFVYISSLQCYQLTVFTAMVTFLKGFLRSANRSDSKPFVGWRFYNLVSDPVRFYSLPFSVPARKFSYIISPASSYTNTCIPLSYSFIQYFLQYVCGIFIGKQEYQNVNNFKRVKTVCISVLVNVELV